MVRPKRESPGLALIGRGLTCYLSGMTGYSPDPTDWRILQALQHEGRATFAELARTVSMSASAVTERVRRLEEAGVIAGYTAVVDQERLGLPILAFVRLRYPNGNYKPFHDLLETTPEILEAHHVTGDDCFVLKVATRSMTQMSAPRPRPHPCQRRRRCEHPLSRLLGSLAGRLLGTLLCCPPCRLLLVASLLLRVRQRPGRDLRVRRCNSGHQCGECLAGRCLIARGAGRGFSPRRCPRSAADTGKVSVSICTHGRHECGTDSWPGS